LVVRLGYKGTMAIPIDAEGWLLPGQYGAVRVVRHERIPKTSTLYSFLNKKPLGIVWHWTAGYYGSGKSRDATNYFIAESYNENRKASWHFLITKDGEIHQFAPVSVATWTTGRPGDLFDPSLETQVRKTGDVNRATIGVELSNSGVLLQGPDGFWYAWPYGIGAEGLSEVQAREKAARGGITFKSAYRVDSNRAVKWNDGNVYDGWPLAQVQAAQEMARAVSSWAGWKDPRHLQYGHRTFDPKRDPGLLWMDGELSRIQQNLFGRSAGGREAGDSSGGSGTLIASLLAAVVGVGAVYFLRRK
jgi:N-acetyl-anhydromuramyl-L-alanine amidase AmpD